MNLTSFQQPELRDANNNIVQTGTYSVKNGVLANAQNTGVLDYINNNLQAHQNAIQSLQTGSLQTKIVTVLPNPSEADANTIYMIKYTSGGEEYYYQYRLIDGSFVRVGDTKIDITDLTNKVTTNTTNITALSNGKLNLSGGTMTGALYIQNATLYLKNPNADVTTNVNYTYNDFIGNDKNNNRLGMIRFIQNGTSKGVVLYAFGTDNANKGNMAIYSDGDGNAYTSAPTPATTDNSTKIATTTFVNNASVKRYDITYTTATNQPWKAIASAFSDMPTGVCLCGVVANGTSFNYFGSKTTSSYGSFIIHSYTDSYMHHVWVYNGTWYYQAITCGSKTSFTV